MKFFPNVVASVVLMSLSIPAQQALAAPNEKVEYFLLENRVFDADGKVIETSTSVSKELTTAGEKELIYTEQTVGPRGMFPDLVWVFPFNGKNEFSIKDLKGKPVTKGQFTSREDFWGWRFKMSKGAIAKVSGHDLIFDKSLSSYYANIVMRDGRKLTKQGRVVKISENTYRVLLGNTKK